MANAVAIKRNALQNVGALMIVCLVVISLCVFGDEIRWGQKLIADPAIVTSLVVWRYVSDWIPIGFYFVFICFMIFGGNSKNSWLRKFAFRYVLAQLICSVFIVRVAKIIFGRGRVNSESPNGWEGPTLDSSFHSFPSGHSADVFVGACFLVSILRHTALRLIVLGLAALVAWSRMALGAHWATDVAVGAALASLTTVAVLFSREVREAISTAMAQRERILTIFSK